MLQFAFIATTLAQVIPTTSLQVTSLPTVTMPPVSVPTLPADPADDNVFF
jgi:hypothetical protein